jgi:hypothetical protein
VNSHLPARPLFLDELDHLYGVGIFNQVGPRRLEAQGGAHDGLAYLPRHGVYYHCDHPRRQAIDGEGEDHRRHQQEEDGDCKPSRRLPGTLILLTSTGTYATTLHAARPSQFQVSGVDARRGRPLSAPALIGFSQFISLLHL